MDWEFIGIATILVIALIIFALIPEEWVGLAFMLVVVGVFISGIIKAKGEGLF